MMFKHGHASVGKCKICKSNIYEKNGKIVCPRCGELNWSSVELNIETKIGDK